MSKEEVHVHLHLDGGININLCSGKQGDTEVLAAEEAKALLAVPTPTTV